MLTDVVLVMPKRKAPSAHIVSAALSRQNGGREEEEDPEEDDKPAQLPSGAPRWEVALTSYLRSRCVGVDLLFRCGNDVVPQIQVWE